MKKQISNEQFRRMQKLAGILTETAQPDIKRENLITFIRFQNGLIFEVGSEDEFDEGVIVRINEYQNGYEVMGYGNGEGYSRYYNFDGSDMDGEDLFTEESNVNLDTNENYEIARELYKRHGDKLSTREPHDRFIKELSSVMNSLGYSRKDIQYYLGYDKDFVSDQLGYYADYVKSKNER